MNYQVHVCDWCEAEARCDYGDDLCAPPGPRRWGFVMAHDHRRETFEIRAELCPDCLAAARAAINDTRGPRAKR